MTALRTDVDPDGLLEYSVVYTDRSLNHMSQSFQGVMRDISATLKQVYNAHAVAVVPGSGTYGMEAVARQLATDQKCLVLRNGWFSYRWSQIFEMGAIPAQELVLKARPAPMNRRHLGSRVRSTRCWPPLRASARPWCLPRTWKPPPACCCPTTTCAPSAKRCAPSMACSCSTASPRGRCGWTCRPAPSMCSSVRRKTAGAGRPPARPR